MVIRGTNLLVKNTGIIHRLLPRFPDLRLVESKVGVTNLLAMKGAATGESMVVGDTIHHLTTVGGTSLLTRTGRCSHTTTTAPVLMPGAPHLQQMHIGDTPWAMTRVTDTFLPMTIGGEIGAGRLFETVPNTSLPWTQEVFLRTSVATEIGAMMKRAYLLLRRRVIRGTCLWILKESIDVEAQTLL